MTGQQKSDRTLYHPWLLLNRNTCNHFLKSRCISELSWHFLKNTNVQVSIFFLQSSRYVSNEQSCLKTTGLHDDLLSRLFHFLCFIFSVPISLSLCFPIFPTFDVLSQPLSSVVEKLCIDINNIYNICILETYEFLPN